MRSSMSVPTSFDPLGMASAVAAALRTGLLAELTHGPTTPSALAQRLGLDLRATTLVLDLLQSVHLVRRDGSRVAPGEALLAAARLPGGHPFTLGLWAHTEEFVRTGE